MKSIQDYRDIYREIARNLNLQGASVEVLVQMLAQASYISEVEQINYVQEASLEKAVLMNSKIQKCMDDMYSVFRGSCPRVIMRIKPKKYISFNMFDEIVSSNNFKVYYLGYYSGDDSKRPEEKPETVLDDPSYKTIAIEEGFTYGPLTICPVDEDKDKSYIIIGLLAAEYSEKEWTITKDNTYFVENLEENLSNDMYARLNGHDYSITRQFSDHIVKANIFDLTLPSFSSRLYVADSLRSNLSMDIEEAEVGSILWAKYFKYSELSDYNKAELDKISIKGVDLVGWPDYEDGGNWLSGRGYNDSDDIKKKGLLLLDAIQKDNLDTIHYKANKDRYVNSIFRSNSDIGKELEEMYPKKVELGGTKIRFWVSDLNTSMLDIYYVPSQNKDGSYNYLTEQEIEDFIELRKSYYVTERINIERGISFTAIFNIDLELYQSNDIKDEIVEILKKYGNKYEINLEEKEEEIKSLISKISNVKSISGYSITYIDESRHEVPIDELEKIYNDETFSKTYFKIDYIINSYVQQTLI